MATPNDKPARDKRIGKPKSIKTKAPRRPRKPFFRTFRARVRFAVLVVLAASTALAAYGVAALHRVYVADLEAAHSRYADSALAPTAGTIEDARLALRGAAALALSSDSSVCASVESFFRDAPDAITRAGFAYADGTVACVFGAPTNREAIGESVAFRRAADTLRFSFGDAMRNDDDNLTMDLAYPASASGADGRRRFVGAVFATLDGRAAAATLAPRDGYLLGLADIRGRVLAQSSAYGRTACPELSPDLVTEIISRRSGLAYADDLDGTRRLYAFRAVTPGGRLYAFAGVPTAVLFAEARRDTFVLSVAATIAVAALAWFALALGHLLITRRARKFAAAMVEVVNGECLPENLPRGLGELDNVASLFAELAARLASTRAGTDEEVKRRVSSAAVNQGLAELQKARLEALLASVGEGVVATGKDGRVLFLNAVARGGLWSQAGRIEDDLVHRVFQLEDDKENVIAPEDWPIFAAMRDRATVTTAAPAHPFHLRRGDGTRFPVKLTVSPVILGDEVVGSLVIVSDITAEVEFDRRKSEFISIASHQLRSPSSAVKFIADMMRKGDFGALTEKQKEWTEKLYAATEAMSGIVDELLNISRVEAGLKMDFTAQDPNAVVAEATKQLEAAFLEKGQKLVFAPAKLPDVAYDRFSLIEVVKNLLGNAVKYSPRGGTITVTVEAAPEGTRFAIADVGVGIPKSEHDQMFRKFFRASNAMKSDVPGTGLGLFYCKTVIEKHGGTIGFDSEEGKGSTFWFVLPNKGPESEKASQ